MTDFNAMDACLIAGLVIYIGIAIGLVLCYDSQKGHKSGG